MVTYFADVFLPLALPKAYTYRVPQELNEQVAPGMRVLVQFGKKKLYTGIIEKIHKQAPRHYQAKYIYELIDTAPVVLDAQFRFWNWMADYYMAGIGEVYNAAFPSGLRVSSETIVVLNPEVNYNEVDLSSREDLVIEALHVKERMTLNEVSKLLNVKNAYPQMRKMIKRGMILPVEEVKDRYKPLMKAYVEFSEKYRSEPALREAFDKLSSAPKQLNAVMKLVELSKWGSDNQLPVGKVALQKAAGVTASQMKTLEEKGIVNIFELEEGRLPQYNATDEIITLSKVQSDVLKKINSGFNNEKPVLLHGITGSGKTEIYIELIKQVIENDGQTLYLLPEIALTTQIVSRLEKQFGNQIAVYHSKFNANERAEVWQELLVNPELKVILGARSAIFLPFHDLQLIVVDEEHESSYKQYDPAPRYNARDAAVVLSMIHKAKILLGSATPSVESYANCKKGKYEQVELFERHKNAVLPEFRIINLKEAYKRKQMKGHISEDLFNAMEGALEKKEQIILFQNRRGFSPFTQCKTCGWTPECTNCDVKLTYHKYLNLLKCHYCGHTAALPKTCPACGGHEVDLLSFGTEKIEDDTQILFPESAIKRMDLETTRGKKAVQQIITAFEDKEVDILVGTQMISKGLDFKEVSVAGIISADQMLNFQDFRADERAFQLMTQVAGRAGRGEKKGTVFIQTFQPEHPVINQVKNNDYKAFFAFQIEDRQSFLYPPYCKLINITLMHKDRAAVEEGAGALARDLRKKFGKRILGPEFPHIARVRNTYRMNIMIKLELSLHLGKNKALIREILIAFSQTKPYNRIRISIDVDPY